MKTTEFTGADCEEAKRLNQLEDENEQLKEIVTVHRRFFAAILDRISQLMILPPKASGCEK